jgi:hypothetical protein
MPHGGGGEYSSLSKTKQSQYVARWVQPHCDRDIARPINWLKYHTNLRTTSALLASQPVDCCCCRAAAFTAAAVVRWCDQLKAALSQLLKV